MQFRPIVHNILKYQIFAYFQPTKSVSTFKKCNNLLTSLLEFYLTFKFQYMSDQHYFEYSHILWCCFITYRELLLKSSSAYTACTMYTVHSF